MTRRYPPSSSGPSRPSRRTCRTQPHPYRGLSYAARRAIVGIKRMSVGDVAYDHRRRRDSFLKPAVMPATRNQHSPAMSCGRAGTFQGVRQPLLGYCREGHRKGNEPQLIAAENEGSTNWRGIYTDGALGDAARPVAVAPKPLFPHSGAIASGLTSLFRGFLALASTSSKDSAPSPRPLPRSQGQP